MQIFSIFHQVGEEKFVEKIIGRGGRKIRHSQMKRISLLFF